MNLRGKTAKKQGRTDPVAGISFAGILAAVYVVYSGIQILFLFLRLDTGLPEGRDLFTICTSGILAASCRKPD